MRTFKIEILEGYEIKEKIIECDSIETKNETDTSFDTVFVKDNQVIFEAIEEYNLYEMLDDEWFLIKSDLK